MLAALGLPEGVAIEGVAWLRDAVGPGRVKIRHATGERELTPTYASGAPLPIRAEHWIAGPLHGLDAIFGALHRELFERLASVAPRLSPSRREAAILHLMEGARHGYRADALEAVTIEQLRPARSLRELLEHLDWGGFVRVAEREDAERAASNPGGLPLFVDDGSSIAAHLAQLIGGRVTPWEHELRARVLGGDGPTIPSFDPPASPSVPVTADRPVQRAAPKRRASPLERALEARLVALGSGTVRVVRVDGRRKRPPVWIEGDVLWLAGRHRVVRAAAEALEVDASCADALLPLLLARAAGELHRGAGRVGAGGEVAILTALLEDVARP